MWYSCRLLAFYLGIMIYKSYLANLELNYAKNLPPV